MKVLMCGGDGYCGWPTSLYLANLGMDVIIVDNLSRRKIDVELGASSLTPIAPVERRVRTWNSLNPDKKIRFVDLDLSGEGERLRNFIDSEAPDAVLHYAEQRAAPYSMKSSRHKGYTLSNNLLSTFNLLEACSEAEKDIHFVHLGSMGVYGYFSRDTVVPEGYMDVQETEDCPGGNGNGNGTAKGSETDMSKFLCQGHPGSIYHATKMQDAILFQFYNINNGLRVTDLHQGVVWGTYTDETRQHESLVNRFDYDGDYGTFINRFLMQAAIGHPITLYGKGGQCRPIIHIKDSMRCVELALTHPPKQNDRVHIYNQTTETYQIRDIAKLVASKTGAEIKHIKNPRVENEDVKYQVDNRTLLNLGLEPTIISDNLMEEVLDVVKRYQHRCDKAVILPRSTWRKDVEIENQPLVDENERPLPVINPTRDAKDDKSAAVH